MAESDLPPAPFIEPYLLWIWRAWHRLSHDRPLHGGGMGPAVPGPIPWRVVRAWAEVYDLTRDRFLMLDRMIQAMDAEYLSWWVKQHPPATTPPPRRLR